MRRGGTHRDHLVIVGPPGGIIRDIVAPPPPPPPPIRGFGATDKPSLLESPLLPKAAMVIAAYHGLRRNNGSLVWGAIWGIAGHFMPLLIPTLAVAQGYAKAKGCSR